MQRQGIPNLNMPGGVHSHTSRFQTGTFSLVSSQRIEQVDGDP